MGSKASIALALAFSLAAGAASADEFNQAKLSGVMNSVFGAGKWRLTGGYRTPERENELRAQGAMTVRPGGLSAHSLGRPGASGARARPAMPGVARNLGRMRDSRGCCARSGRRSRPLRETL